MGKSTIKQGILELDTSTLISIGLLEADMTRGGNNLVFSNSEPTIINHVLSWFNRNFSIPKSKWRWSIQFNKKIVRTESSLKIKARELASFLFWIKNTGINEHKHFPKWTIYRGFDKGELDTENRWVC